MAEVMRKHAIKFSQEAGTCTSPLWKRVFIDGRSLSLFCTLRTWLECGDVCQKGSDAKRKDYS